MEHKEPEIIEKSRSGIRKYLYDVFNIRDDMMSYEEIDAMMEENTVIHGANMWILMMAALIASIGLNVNSTAVIIGAMLISPLMGSILAIAYGTAANDSYLIKRHSVGFLVQILISVATATLYFLLSPVKEPTEQLIARTNPTLFDVIIALAGGVAGIVGQTRKDKQLKCSNEYYQVPRIV